MATTGGMGRDYGEHSEYQQRVAETGATLVEACGRARGALAVQAADDWAAFVAARAADLRPGGRLLVQCVGTHLDAAGRELVTARALLAAMWAVAVELADEGLLEMGAVERFVFPVYARTAEEARAPFEGPESAFEVVELSVAPGANPYLDAWHADGNIDAYARDYTAFVRGFSESALRRGLLGDTIQAAAADRLMDEYFRRLEDRFRQHPEADAFRDWTLTVVARRR